MTTLSRRSRITSSSNSSQPLHRLLDEHLADRALAQAALDLGAQLRRGRDEAAAVAAERERRPDDRGHGDAGEVVDAR